MRRWRGVGHLHFQAYQQGALLAWLVVPPRRHAKARAVLDAFHVASRARVGQDDTPLECKDAHLLTGLEALVVSELVGQRGRDILGGWSSPR